MTLLERILDQKRIEIARLASIELPEKPPRRAVDLPRMPGTPLRLIAEIKRRSPSAGVLSRGLSIGERARSYERAGASAISVLTDETFFDGSFSHLAEARASSSLPLLCKDFVLGEIQLDAARAFGADLVLVIVRCLAPGRVAELVQAARERELEPLVEVVTHAEVEIALGAGARLIGVNARDLDTLAIDAERATRVLEALPEGIVAIHLSGLKTPEDVASVARSRADAALIGEALMRLDDPIPLLGQMVRAASGEQ